MSNVFKVQKLVQSAKIPVREFPTDAGMDFFSASKQVEEIKPHARMLIPTGLRVQVPEGWALILKDKSGIATNQGIDVRAGVIDSSYRGEVKVLLYNSSDAEVWINPGQKICQGLLVPVGLFDIVETEIPIDTQRGTGGFGSTGV